MLTERLNQALGNNPLLTRKATGRMFPTKTVYLIWLKNLIRMTHCIRRANWMKTIHTSLTCPICDIGQLRLSTIFPAYSG